MMSLSWWTMRKLSKSLATSPMPFWETIVPSYRVTTIRLCACLISKLRQVERLRPGRLAKMELTPRHRNAMNNVMGGAIFTLGDLAISALGCHLHLPVVGLNGSIDFLSTAKGDVLYARATCRKNGRTTIVMQCDITDDTGRLVAIMNGTAFKVRQS